MLQDLQSEEDMQEPANKRKARNPGLTTIALEQVQHPSIFCVLNPALQHPYEHLSGLHARTLKVSAVNMHAAKLTQTDNTHVRQ